VCIKVVGFVIVVFTRKINIIPFVYKLCGSHINHMDTIKDLGIILDAKLYFHPHVCSFALSFLLMFTMDINSALPHLKLLALMFLKILEIFLCLLLVLHVKIVPPLDVHQLQIQCVKMLTYLEIIWLCLSIF
jgi:hypothetical protein